MSPEADKPSSPTRVLNAIYKQVAVLAVEEGVRPDDTEEEIRLLARVLYAQITTAPEEKLPLLINALARTLVGQRIDNEYLKNLDGVQNQKAFTDALTGLPNRAAFDQQIQDALLTKDSIALFIIDLNKFKPINDKYGHPVGDQALKEFAGVLKSLKAPVKVARIGGDEFTVIAENMPPEELSALLVELEEKFKNISFDCDGMRLSFGASFGMAHANRGDTNWNASSLKHEADLAMYAKKGAGRDPGAAHESTPVPSA